jgi:hypothetical protein
VSSKYSTDDFGKLILPAVVFDIVIVEPYNGAVVNPVPIPVPVIVIISSIEPFPV